MKTEILKFLKDEKEGAGFVSGQELCDRFGVSRTAVWKAIGQLKEEGFQIEAVRNKGYRLLSSDDVITEAELMSSMEGSFIKKIVYYDVTDSTNIRAKRLAEEGAPHGTLVVADCQDAGRGRRGRMWVSPTGTGIFMSLILRPDILPSSASMLTLVAALAVSDGIREAAGVETSIKWPNDIVADGKKLCGILTEMSAELEGIHYVVTGIGINTNTKEFPEEVSGVATSLRMITGSDIRRSSVIAAVMKAYEQYYEKFKAQGSLAGLMDVYNEHMVNLGREVNVLDPAGSYMGRALGINEKGELLVEREDGKVNRVVSGEVSVRGIYGYV